MAIYEVGESPQNTRISRPNLNDDLFLCATLYSGFGELYPAAINTFVKSLHCSDHSLTVRVKSYRCAPTPSAILVSLAAPPARAAQNLGVALGMLSRPLLTMCT